VYKSLKDSINFNFNFKLILLI